MPKVNSQMSLFNIYEGASEALEEKKPEFLRLLDKYIDWNKIIPIEFYFIFYRHYGRNKKYHLESIIRALVLQKVLGFISDKQLLMVLKCSTELREFCGFFKVPDASVITRFKQKFLPYIAAVFDKLVDITEPICSELDEKKAKYLIFDTTGIEANVYENNPKFLNTKLKEAKKLTKLNPDYNPYMGVYKLLPDFASANSEVKQQYINGHYCYSVKAGILTNGLGIIRNISFLDDDFRIKHPETVSKKSDNPDIDKEIGDSSALKPVLNDFFTAHPSASFSTFIGDSAFDSYDNYSFLMGDLHFKRAIIPMNSRNSRNSSTEFDDIGRPICPLDKTPMTFLGKSGGKNRSVRYKWVCHKSVQSGSGRLCTCVTPCTDSSYGRCVYTYPDKNLRLYPGVPRGSEHWDNIYKHRVTIERTINLLKDSFCTGSRKSYNSKTLKADFYLAGIVQLLGVLIAKAISKPELFKSVRKLLTA